MVEQCKDMLADDTSEKGGGHIFLMVISPGSESQRGNGLYGRPGGGSQGAGGSARSKADKLVHDCGSSICRYVDT